MIEVSGLSKRFGTVQAVSDVSFSVPRGQIVGFLGANGAGKTTTMDIMCGCIGADAGSVRIGGFDIMEAPLAAKQRLGYLPDQAPLHPEMRVRDYVNYAARLHRIPSSAISSRVDAVLGKLELGDVAQRLVGNLSKGYRQRVALAQAIVHEPEVLVLDEPTEGLDPNQIIHIRELIRSLAGQHTIILSSHILSEVQNTCDHIVIIHGGRIVAQGSYEELISRLSAGRLYRLKTARDAARLVSALEKTPGVVTPHVIDGSAQEIEFGIGKSDAEGVLDDVARHALDGGFGLRELTPKTASLEEVFFQVTHH